MIDKNGNPVRKGAAVGRGPAPRVAPPPSRVDRDEQVLVLCSRMLARRAVWVDSPVGQKTWVQMIGLEDGQVIVYDTEGNDRPWDAYLLSSPERLEPDPNRGYLSEDVQEFMEICEIAQQDDWDFADVKSHILWVFPGRFREAMELDRDE